MKISPTFLVLNNSKLREDESASKAQKSVASQRKRREENCIGRNSGVL